MRYLKSECGRPTQRSNEVRHRKKKEGKFRTSRSVRWTSELLTVWLNSNGFVLTRSWRLIMGDGPDLWRWLTISRRGQAVKRMPWRAILKSDNLSFLRRLTPKCARQAKKENVTLYNEFKSVTALQSHMQHRIQALNIAIARKPLFAFLASPEA